MKHIILTIAIVLAALTGFAQEEVAIEQYINQSVKKLYINPGWDVRLIHAETDSTYRVAIVTTVDFAALAYNVQLCNLKDRTLTILENTKMPQSTVVEIEGPMTFDMIALMNRATVEADKIIAPQPEQTNCRQKSIFVARYANLHIRNYHIPNQDCLSNIEIWDNAKCTIDTISGDGYSYVTTYNTSDFQIVTNNLNGEIILDEYDETPGWHYQKKDSRVIKNKEVDGEIVTTNRRKIWQHNFNVWASFGYRWGTNPPDANSPLLEDGTLSINVGANTDFQLSCRWSLSTGILLNANRKSLCHQVKYEDDALVVVDGQEDFKRNRLKSYYIGIPVVFNYYLGKRHTDSFSFDIFCGRLIGEELRTSKDATNLLGLTNWDGENIKNTFNPWKLEVGISFNTNMLGIFHGIRVFTNLLPEYKPGVTSSEIRNIGIEIKF